MEPRETRVKISGIIGLGMRLDEIGYWSELKLEIIRKYASAYSRILSNQKRPSFHHVYIDGFSGAGTHISKTSGEEVQGSPLIALEVEPPFREYFLIDLDGEKVEYLRSVIGDRLLEDESTDKRWTRGVSAPGQAWGRGKAM